MTDRTSFSSHDRRRLARALQRTDNVRLFRHVQAVLRVAEGVPISSTARTLRISRSSLHRWVKVYLRRHQPEDLLDALRPGSPRTADDLDEAGWRNCWPKIRACWAIARRPGSRPY